MFDCWQNEALRWWRGWCVLLFQICQNDLNFYSYVEMPVRCRSSDEEFNVVVAAALLEGPSTSLDDTILAAVFQSLRHNEDVSSALCLYRMSRVRQLFTTNIRRCFAGQQTYVGLQFSNRLCVSTVSQHSTASLSQILSSIVTLIIPSELPSRILNLY